MIDFSAMADELNRQQFLFSVGLVNDPVVAHAKLEETRKEPGQGFWLKGVEIFGKPAKPFQHTLSHHEVEVFNVLGSPRAKFDLVHLPFQAPTPGQFSRRNILARALRLLKIPQKPIPNFGPKSKTGVGINQKLAQLFFHHLADNRL
jgi:hypothetical protein